ncbi:MAG: glycosyltransferase, partial [bacterium]|nr:glycosyltransferase [bacterium]
MKILQIGKYYPPYYGGMETTLYNLCAEFSKNHEVTVLVSNTDNKTVHEKIDGVNVIRLKRFCKIASTDICPTMFRYIEASDIIHIHSPNPTAEVSYMAARPKGKVVITYHSDVVKQKMLGKIYSPVFNKILKKADKILATSAEYVNGSIWLSKYSEKVNIVPLGIDIKFFMNK